MPRTPGGDYILPEGQPAEPNTVIESNVHNVFADDLAVEVQDSLSRTGKGGMLVPLRVLDGTFDNPAFSFTSDFTTGMYYKQAEKHLAFSADRVNAFTITKIGTFTAGYAVSEQILGTNQGLASETSTDHAMQAGLTDQLNVKIGADGFQAMSNGMLSALHLNKDGGALYINNVKYEPGGGTGGLYFVDGFQPTSGTEYPDTTSHTPGAFWLVENVGSYTFAGGDLVGQTANDGDAMVFGEAGWYLSVSSIDPTAYVKKSGDTMTGQLIMQAEASGQRFIQFSRDNGTFKSAIGNADATEELMITLADSSGTSFVSNIKLIPDGNVRADFAAPADDKDLITKEYGDAHYLGGSGGGDFMSDGSVPMTGWMVFNAEGASPNSNIIRMLRSNGTEKVLMGTQDGSDVLNFFVYNDAAAVINTLVLMDDGNISADHANPNADSHLITKAYGDANYGGGGGGDYLPLAGGTMAGDILMNADATGKRFIGFTRDNDTFKAGIGNQTTAEEFEITLANAAGDAYVSNLKLLPDGNVRAEFATPAHDDDLVTKAYGDTHYLSGTGGGDFYADGSVPMTGIFQMNAPATGVMFSRILRDDGTLKLAYGSRDTVNQFELLLANAAGDVEVNKLILKENGNLAAPFASPAADDDLVTKGYGDTHYSGGGGGGDFMADGSVPMTGDFDGGSHKLTKIADGVAADDAATMSQLAASGGGDFMANGTIPMTGTMTFDAPSSGVIFTRILRSDGTFKLAYGSRDTANQFELLLANTAGDAEINKLLLKADGNIEAPFASPAANGDLVTKQYGDANYLGGGGGDFYADGHVPMTGDLLMDADAGGSRAIQIRRDDGTLKCALGSWSDSEELELLLADVAGTTEVARLLLRADGNVAAPDATPTAVDDLVTRAYGDAHYLGGSGGGDFMADGSVPMTGNMDMNAPSGDAIFTRIYRTDGTLKAAYGSRSTDEELEFILANDSGLTEIATMKLMANGNLQVPSASPQSNTDLTTKEYVDNAVKAETVYDMGVQTQIDVFFGTILKKTLTEDTTFTIALNEGESVTLHLRGGDSNTATLPAGTKWVGDRPTVLTAHDVFIIWNDGTDDFASYSGAVT